MENIQHEQKPQKAPDNIFIIIGIITFNAYILFYDAIPKSWNNLDYAAFHILMIVIVYLDSFQLKKSGYEPTVYRSWVLPLGALFLIVWIWHRYSLQGNKIRLLFWVTLISVVFSVYYSDQKYKSEAIAEVACGVTTKILSKQMNNPAASSGVSQNSAN